MASKIGRLEEFDYTTYAERIEHYFKANDVAEDKKKDALLASIGGKTFTLLRSLTAFDFSNVISGKERASNNRRLSFKNSRSIAILGLR